MVYNLITLYSPEETEFETNGLGSLSGDALSCIITEEGNGAFELELTYPVTGRHYDDIKARCIIFAKPNPVDNPQAFRIYQITRPINGVITCYAQHISYDLSGCPVRPFSAANCASALYAIKQESVIEHNFYFSTDVVDTTLFDLDTLKSARSLLGGEEGSILDIYGGEYKFDNFHVRLCNHRGMDRGVVIRYGKNLTDLNQEEKFANIYTGVYPYWIEREYGDILELPEGIVKCSGTYNFENILLLDCTSQFQDAPSDEELREYANSHIEDNGIGKPEVNLTVSFVQLEQTEEYKNIALLERVELFDTVHVEFPEMGVSSTAKVAKTEYNVLTGRYESIELGSIKASISDTMISQESTAKDLTDRAKSDLERAIENATKWITNGKGYMVAVKDEAGTWTEICSLDTPNIEEAIQVWRWNNGGFGHSSHGYDGPYDTAITQDGHIVANFIDTGELTASIIKAGVLQDATGKAFYLDLPNGILKMNATELSIGTVGIDDYIANNLSNFTTAVLDPAIADLQKQIDGQIETWYYDYAPELNKAPSNTWTSEDVKKKHEGDLFFNRTNGLAYRFMKSGSSWIWQMIQDTDVTKALQDAANAQDTADDKRRVFVSTPTPPYDIGDLWVQGLNGDILRCSVKKEKGGTYAFSDWVKASKYIDLASATSEANTAVGNAMTQRNIFNTLTNNGAMEGLFMRDGDLYINASYLVTGILASVDNETFFLDLDRGILKLRGEIIVGGKDNTSGSVVVMSPDGTKKLVILDNKGITLDSSVRIAWANISGTPTIPTKTSELTNNSGYITSSAIPQNVSDLYNDAGYLTKYTADIPKNVSDLYNDLGFLTKSTANIPSTSDIVQIMKDNRGTVITKDYIGTLKVVAGSVDVTMLSAISTNLGAVTAGKLLSSNYVYSTGNFSSSGTLIDLSNGMLRSKQFTVDSSGNAHFKGSLEAASGSFNGSIESVGSYGGVKINTGMLKAYYGSSTFAEIGISGNSLTWFNMGKSLTSGGPQQTQYSTSGMLRFSSNVPAIFVYGGSIYFSFFSDYVIDMYTDLRLGGDFTVKGTKRRVSQTKNYQNRLLYCYETPSPIFGDIGEATTDENGECYLFLDDIFSETVSAEIEYQVFLQKEGPGDVWISEKTPQYFVVKGTENLKFAWEIKAKQKGYEYERMEIFDQHPTENIDYEQQYMDELDSLIKEQEVSYI